MIIQSPIGDIRVFTGDGYVQEILLPGWRADIEVLSRDSKNEFEEKLSGLFEDYFAADSLVSVKTSWELLVRFSGFKHALSQVSSFHANAYESLVSGVEVSQMVSYSELAELAGSPLAARAVGTAMRKNPLPIIVPCHRVISADGGLGGYMGNGEDNMQMKKWLLHHEGAI